MTYRLIRLLEYVGTREWVDQQVEARGVKGSYKSVGGYIREALIGETPELLLASEVAQVEADREKAVNAASVHFTDDGKIELRKKAE